jgi:hypothetical protein
MADKTGKTQSKRLSKSERTHRRRLKQEARKSAEVGKVSTRESNVVRTQETPR